MKIGIEGISLQKHPRGVGNYFLSLVRMLIAAYPNAEFICYSNKDIVIPEELMQKIELKKDTCFLSRLNPTIWLKLRAGALIRKDRLDYYLSGAGLLPRLDAQTKCVVLVHDLNYILVPRTMGRLHWLAHRFFLKRDVCKANFVVVNSMGTAEKVEHYFGKKVDCIINPPTEKYFKKLPDSEIQPILNKLGIDYPYLLTVGTLEPRKNLGMTIKVFLKLLEKGMDQQYKLVVVGAKGWKDSAIIALCDQYKDNITRLGYVNDCDLPALYNGASAFLFPSFYEGFGMPAREAVCCGCPVITSDLVELKEATFGKAHFINPFNAEDYRKALLSVLKEKTTFQREGFQVKETDASTFVDFFKAERSSNEPVCTKRSFNM